MGASNTYQQRTQGFCGVIKASHNAETQHRDNSDSVRVNGERAAADRVRQCGRSDHGNQLDTGQNDGNQKWVLIAGILDCFPLAPIITLAERLSENLQ